MTGTFTGILSAILIAIGLAACGGGNDAPPPGPGSPCDAADTTSYGTGEVSFMTPGAGDTFAVAGKYRTSMEFAGDSVSQGAGGFLSDTVIGGVRLKAELTAYSHRRTRTGIDERLLVLQINDTAHRPTPGTYPFHPSGSAPAGPSATGLYLYYADSLGIFSAYEFASGVLTLTSIDTCLKACRGTFSGTLRGLPPDTATSTVIRSGAFTIQLVPRPFSY